MFARGVIVTYEAIRSGAGNLARTRPIRDGPAAQARRYVALDEVFLTIAGERHDRWRAVDQDGRVLDILGQSHWNKTAAKKCFQKLLKRLPMCRG